jgi:hypothetical protein
MTVRAHRDRTGGFVLMEALVALVLLALTLGLFAATLGFGRRVAAAGEARDRMAEVATGTGALAAWLAGAVPAREARMGGASPARFEGRSDGLSFVTLSNGDVMPGGLLAMTVVTRGRTLAFEAGPLPVGQIQSSPGEAQILLDGIAAARFRYYGSPQEGAPADWHEQWRNADRLPRLVGLQATIILDRRSEAMDFTFRIPVE